MSKINYVSIDIDGTLYPHKGLPVNPKHVKSMQNLAKRLWDKDVQVSLITGKIVGYVENAIEMYGLIDAPEKLVPYNVIENGTVIMRYKKWPYNLDVLPELFCRSDFRLHLLKVNQEITKKFNTISEAGKIGSLSISPPQGMDTNQFYPILVDFLRKDLGFNIVDNKQQDQLFNDSKIIQEMLMNGKSIEEIKDFVHSLGRDFFIANTPTAVDVTPYPLSKGLGLCYVAANYGYDLGNAIYFGDSQGDFPVFELLSKEGGLAFAVGSASQEVKEFTKSISGYALKEDAPICVFSALEKLIECDCDKEEFKKSLQDIVEL